MMLYISKKAVSNNGTAFLEKFDIDFIKIQTYILHLLSPFKANENY